MPCCPNTAYRSPRKRITAGGPARPVTDRQLDEADLVNRVVDIYRCDRCVYGVREMWRAARREGLRIGRDQMGRLMRVAGIQGVRRGVHHTATTIRDQRAARHPGLVKRAWADQERGAGRERRDQRDLLPVARRVRP
ncbi:IS3 family transposase [Pseudonocardia sp. RS010]|uniref:IS3 family transposase n=1 Tax=Pseudonocardia sp. RS010 TaxID=3385979 RepID=UPI0039A0E2BC